MALAHPAPVPRLTGLSAPLRWAALLALAALLVIGGGAALDAWRAHRAAVSADPAALSPGFGPRNYFEALARADGGVDEARRRLAMAPGEWLREEGLARQLVSRHRLTGDYADLAEAERLLDDATARAPDPGGPVLSQAQLAVLLHRLAAAEAALAEFARFAAPEPGESADAEALRGDIALQRGQMDEAARHYARGEALAPSAGLELRSAVLDLRRGHRDAAREAMNRLLLRPRQSPAALAQLALQRAALAYAEGSWDEARRWIAAADRTFPGYWLVEAHGAQALALSGRTAEAIGAYAAVARKSQAPEVMDALALLLRMEGRPKQSREWSDRAGKLWQERLARFPEAARQHAAEHELIAGNPERAVALARADVAARPHGAAIVVLARALVLAGRPAEALACLDRAQAQGWTSAGSLMQRAEAEAALGNGPASAAARTRAEAINPRAADPRTRLIWFGHD
ncbi:tetratricopeptide repeat protein [Novosphingobium tardum]|uniref:Tetratricopeptide repeat protein n=1 Tax=Novosphingobium tardum TaxID=1538021 RepID=A0ABV8RRD8_9SPHN